MRNMLIIAGCALLVLATGALILFGGEWFGRETDEPRRPASASAERDDQNRPAESDAKASALGLSPESSTIGETKTAPRSTLPGELAEAARQINAAGPIRIDEMTMMTAASSAGNRITYRYEISRQLSAQQVASFRELAASNNRRVLCGRDETRTLISLGGEIEYVYFDPTGRRLFSTPVTGC